MGKLYFFQASFSGTLYDGMGGGVDVARAGKGSVIGGGV